ncbi:MAG: M4 family metallopeptidase [Acidobacteriota bacterium]|nr:M4 family metallopeptidase [Acidobacteriota bacterium]
MKKNISIFATLLAAVAVFAFLTKTAEADKTVFGSGSLDDTERVKQISLNYLRDNTASRSIGSADELKVKSVEFDELNMAHTKVFQTVNEIPVWEGEAIVHIKSDGSLSTITDNLKDSLVVNTQPNFSADEAIELAKKMYNGKGDLTEKPSADLWIYRAEDRDHLTYRVEMPRLDGTEHTSIPVIFVDAQTGENVFEYNNLQTGSGPSLYSGTINISTSSVGSTFYMEDLTRKQGTFNMNNTGSTLSGSGGTQSRYTDTNDVWDATTQRAGLDAHYGAAMTYDYYKNVHRRNGINGSGGPGTTTAAANSGISLITSRVHFGSNYNNAFWSNNQMTYGDGDGTSFSPLVTLDIAGHEMTHGVTQYSANLTYSNESGALNESMSDVFGAMVELYARGGTVTTDTWKIGEQSYTPSTTGDALRYMDNPHAKSGGGYTADDDPDHYSERYTGTSDSGGVHINSGIGNHAFYLAAAGGTQHRSGVTVTGIGTTDAAKIWYRALTVYMTSGTNFAGARTAMLNAATDLFGASSAEYNTIATTWCAVGVGSCPTTSTPTPTPTPTVTPTPTPGGGGELIVNGGFEGSVSPWVSSGTGAFYTANGSYPHGGTGYIYFGVNNSVSGQSYQTVSIPSSATGTLNFWLNVTSSETGTTQYDKLFVEVRNTSGSLLATLATYSNVNKGTAGVYSQKSLNLAAYKGQTVRVQFRSTMDSSVTTTFRVDDASLK